ncbi:hypothetical protein D918_09389 [Trichuris suis]|uniref:DUF7041 domain-containing protein n=1 Tax=Trichuris suis TaxID=68888 RepID=A0A085LP22_9BILA|nr:hypothetical protein M513_12428 [Trichuris suis]KHJ40553.1 hypothetical protein D918_09389 [Trichuris suis]
MDNQQALSTQRTLKDPEELSVHRVTAKLPPFWPDRPALWFAQVEAQFTLAGITQDATKFAYVVSQLESRYAAEVEDIIVNLPPN